METLPPAPDSVTTQRVVQELHARRPAIIFILTVLAVVFLCITIGSLLERSRLQSALADATSQLASDESDHKKLSAEFDTITQQQAALKAEYEDGISWTTAINRGVRSFFDGFTLGAYAERGPATELKNLEDWNRQLNIRGATLRARASQLERDIKKLTEHGGVLAATRSTIQQDYDHQGARRSWCFAFAVSFGFFALAASRTRPGEIIVTTLYSVATSFGPTIMPPVRQQALSNSEQEPEKTPSTQSTGE